MARVVMQHYRLYFIPSRSYDRSRIVLPGKRQTLEVERTLKEFQELGGLWTVSEYWEDDPDCSRKASQERLPDRWLMGPFRKTGELSVAGIRAIEYSHDNDYSVENENSHESESGHISQTIALAPSLGCTIIAFDRSERNRTGLLISKIQSRLSSVTIREPDHDLFAIPAGYAERHYSGREDRYGKEWPNIWIDLFHGNTDFREP